MIRELQKLTKLRKLGIMDLKENDGRHLCGALLEMISLRSLDVASRTEEEFLDLRQMKKPPEHLQRLRLKGRLRELPYFVTRLHDLQRIRLMWSKLSYSPIDALQELPNLTELKLLDVYTGKLLSFPARKFQNLKILELVSLRELNTLIMENGTLPNLQTLTLMRCGSMTIAPLGIQNLSVLENLHLYDMPEAFLRQLGYISLERRVPHVCIYKLADDGSWKKRELA